MVMHKFGSSYPRTLRAFVEQDMNKWCPPWIRTNYLILNEDSEDEDGGEDAYEQQLDASGTLQNPAKKRTHKKVRYVFEEEDGEPPQDKEETAATTLDAWSETRAPWQLHSEAGPNINAAGYDLNAQPWMSHVNPPEFDWESQWKDVDIAELRRLLDERRKTELEYDCPDLTKEALGDDFQRLFIDILLTHVGEIMGNSDNAKPVPPLRLLLLGTAGTGKTQAVKTLLQEIKRTLRCHACDGNFVCVAAPTGCAAFNIRFGATTLHRLFQILRPNHFQNLREDSMELLRFQEMLRHTRLVIIDEISMVGKTNDG